MADQISPVAAKNRVQLGLTLGDRPQTRKGRRYHQLIADRFSAIPARHRSTRDTARSWLLIRRQLAFYPLDPDSRVAGALTPHPDVLFALRLTASTAETAAPERPFAKHEDQ